MNERLEAALNWCKKREEERQKLKPLKTKGKMATLHRTSKRLLEAGETGETHKSGESTYLQENIT